MENGMELMKKLEGIMGSEQLLGELLRALSNDELTENAEYIARMWDINLLEVVKC